ncbi:geranial dehydrogenase [Solimonas aquatica]|uniref:Geranial dehydrogenase n=1 Tax=Solimonas aquatica TaxID=489703 RepID=A0A1H9B992_9GAMM|nr:aldehyde dehydrogenase [Solimonas aquatica]SEP85582.1 geranial dehydrogenase [Solimonas aquatica]
MQSSIPVHHEKFYIDGTWQKPATTLRIEVIGANNGELIGSVPEGGQADIDAAVTAARRAVEGGWSESSPAERAAVLNRFADAIEKRGDRLSRAVSMQNGMPLSLAEQLEVGYVVGLLRYYAALAQGLQTEERRHSPLGFDTLVRRKPVGVVGAIVPWNYPVVLSIMKIAPALATGCSIVLKPSPGTVLDCYILAEAAEEAGVPAGVLNWVPGGRDLGAYLVAHPGIDKVAFTGSTAAGRKIAEVCGRLLRPVSLELGGKSAGIILDDAKLDQVLPGLHFAAFGNNGQTCALSSRILVPATRYDEIVEALAELAKSLKVGDSLDRTTEIGPLASAEHRERVESYIARGKSEGRLVAGGGRPRHLARGWFVEPTVFADVANSATIAQEEIFGPVLTVIKYRDEDEAVKIANDSDYGLGGTVWSADSQRAQTVARRVQTGTIGVNGYVLDMASPFGGIKASGLGRELGPESLAAYQQLQSVYLTG